MLSPSLSFRRPAFFGVSAPVFAVIIGLAGQVAAQPAPTPAPPAPPPGGFVAVGPAPIAPPALTPAMAPPPPYVPAPAWPTAQPAPWAPQPQGWGPQPAPGYWPQYAPAAPPSAGFYPQQEPFSLPPPTPKEAAHGTMMKVGIAASIGGVATLITGSILMSIAKERIDVYRDGPTYCCSIDDAPLRNAGITMLVIGGITATIGVPLWMIGGRRVPVRKTTTEAPAKTPASAAPLLRVGATGASLSWQF